MNIGAIYMSLKVACGIIWASFCNFWGPWLFVSASRLCFYTWLWEEDDVLLVE